MWALKFFLTLLILGIICRIVVSSIEFFLVGKKSFDGFRRGVKRYSLPSSMVSMAVAALCMIVGAPIGITFVMFFASFVVTIFILLGNDEDSDQFRKL